MLAVLNPNGALHQRFSYTPFGVEMEGDPIGNPFRYTGQRYDPETGLYYYRARYYDANLGRFLQVDPIGYEDQWNLHAYVGNNPLNATDPSGAVGRSQNMHTDHYRRSQQGLVQEMLDAPSPDGYAQIIFETNSVLNLKWYEILASNALRNDMAYRNIISQVRNDLGRDLDFGDINDRIAIGDAVMSAIREDSMVVCTGSRIQRAQC